MCLLHVEAILWPLQFIFLSVLPCCSANISSCLCFELYTIPVQFEQCISLSICAAGSQSTCTA